MAGYTIRNLKQVEDQAPKFGLSPGLEARFGREQLECENMGISYQVTSASTKTADYGFANPPALEHPEDKR